MKSLVFPRIFLHCVALGFIVSGLLLSVRPGVRILSDPLSMEDALTSAAEALREQGWDLTVVDRQDNAVQVTLTAADGASGDQALLDETMESAGFTAAGDWYIFENSKEETDP